MSDGTYTRNVLREMYWEAFNQACHWMDENPRPSVTDGTYADQRIKTIKKTYNKLAKRFDMELKP